MAAACGSSADEAGSGPLPDSPDQQLANAKAEAVEDLAPATWQVAVDTALEDDPDPDSLSTCGPDSGFDLATIDDVTTGYAEVALAGTDEGLAGSGTSDEPQGEPSDGDADAELDAAGESDASSGNPTFDASVQVRVFDTEQSAAAAYDTLLGVLTSDDGRDCLASEIEKSFGDSLPAGSTVEVAPASFPAADASVVVTVIVEAEGLSGEVNLQFVAKRDGRCTVVATYLGLDGDFPPDLARRLFSAAVTASPGE